MYPPYSCEGFIFIISYFLYHLYSEIVESRVDQIVEPVSTSFDSKLELLRQLIHAEYCQLNSLIDEGRVSIYIEPRGEGGVIAYLPIHLHEI